MNKLYLFILLLIVILSLYNINYFSKLPEKLKVINFIVSITSFSKGISQLILFFKDSLNYVFILKPFISLGLIYIPLISFLTIIILAKKNKTKNVIFICAIIVSILLYSISYIFNYNIEIEKGYIYSIRYENSLNYQVYFYIAVIAFAAGINYLSKIKEKAMYYLFQFSSFIFIIDSILYIYNVVIFPENLLGDLLFLLLFNRTLNKIKK